MILLISLAFIFSILSFNRVVASRNIYTSLKKNTIASILIATGMIITPVTIIMIVMTAIGIHISFSPYLYLPFYLTN